MSGTPPAEVEIDEVLVRRLLTAQHPDLAHLPLSLAASGWDNAMVRIGDRLAARLPRRAMGARLIENEQRWLPELGRRLPLPIPSPVRIGGPDDGYPWRWSIVPWFEGDTADIAPPNDDQAGVLGAFFAALHRPAPDDAPLNLYRGVPLSDRADAYTQRCDSLLARGEHLDARLPMTWEAALKEPIDVAPTWLQGDPHPRNVLVSDGRIVAMLDWGDLCRGDRASDLASVWMIFSGVEARRRMMTACGQISEATWRRARGWAVLYEVMLLDAGLADDPRMAAIARRTFANLLAGP